MVQPNTHIDGIVNLNLVELVENLADLHLQDSPSSFNSLPSSGVPEPEEIYGDTTATAANAATGDNNIDGLLTTHRWQSTTVTYSFTSNFANDYEDELDYSDSAVHAASFETLNATQRAVAREVMEEMYEAVSGLNMVELTGSSDRDATIRIAESDDPSGAYAYNPGNYYEAGDVWFNTTDYNNPVIGNYAYYTFMHEFGHALGLKHGHETGGVADVAMNSNRDSMEFSVMTYRSYEGAPTGGVSNETWGYAQSLMMYDIAAIQQMYGANFNTNSSNTTYTFSTTTGEMFVNGVGQGTPGGNRVFRTIWDGNGTDTYDFSNYTTNLAINLTPGGWSDLDVGGNFQRAQLGTNKYARGHVFNALQYNGDTRSLIENANGGSGNDIIEGNSANNVLHGNGGNDTINGGGGDDYMDGGAGWDTVDYSYWGGGGTYNLATGVASFPGFYDEEILNFEAIITGAGNDNVIGSAADNRIETGAGNDTISGGGGDDYMDGGAGWDTVDYSYWGGGGTYNLATGVASFPGFYDEEILNFEAIITGAGNDNVIGSATENRIETGAGNDTVSGGADNDSLNGYGRTIGEYDVLSGDYSFSQPGVQDTSDGADTFILGDAFGAYYLGLGYATITDFYWYEGDKFQVHGSVGDYSLGFQNWSGDSLNDTLIYYQSDLIAVVEDTTNVIASLDFIFV